MAPPLPLCPCTAPQWHRGMDTMRSPNGPLFKTYEIAAIVLFLMGAILVTGAKLVY